VTGSSNVRLYVYFNVHGFAGMYMYSKAGRCIAFVILQLASLCYSAQFTKLPHIKAGYGLSREVLVGFHGNQIQS
jgi:hypothetical protein